MRFAYSITKNKDRFVAVAKDFVGIRGYGRNKDIAFSDFFESFRNFLRDCVTKDQIITIPGYDKDETTFGLPFNLKMKIIFHNLRVDSKVTKPELARLLAIESKQVGDSVWSLENLRRVDSDVTPKYKNAQRLIDLDHSSTVREMEHGFRVLGYEADIVVRKK